MPLGPNEVPMGGRRQPRCVPATALGATPRGRHTRRQPSRMRALANADVSGIGVHSVPLAERHSFPGPSSYTCNAGLMSSLQDIVSREQRVRRRLVATLPTGSACLQLFTDHGLTPRRQLPSLTKSISIFGPAAERDFLTFPSYPRVSVREFRAGTIWLLRRRTPMQTVRYRRFLNSPNNHTGFGARFPPL